MIYQRIVSMLQFMGDKPNTLAKFLLEKGAFSEEWLRFVKSDKFMQTCYDKDYTSFAELEHSLDTEIFNILPDPYELYNWGILNVKTELEDALSKELYDKAAVLKKHLDYLTNMNEDLYKNDGKTRLKK
jgi:hypothetical protein